MSFRKSLFALDDWFGSFEGWTTDQYWNGWACPYFERDVALHIVNAWNSLAFGNEVFRARYEEDQDGSVFIQPMQIGNTLPHRPLLWKANKSLFMQLVRMHGCGKKLGRCKGVITSAHSEVRGRTLADNRGSSALSCSCGLRAVRMLH